jgi:hypothetical protein
MAANILTGQSVWGDTSDAWSLVIATGSTLAGALLWVGWWDRSTTLMQHGLALTAVLFTMRGNYIGLASGAWLTAGLSYAWALAASGAWLLERTTGGGDVR